MAFWKLAEQELFITINNAADGDSDVSSVHRAHMSSNWPYYVTRLEACEGFTVAEDHRPEEGGRQISGEVDLSEFAWFRLRAQLSDGQLEEFALRRAELPSTPVITHSAYKPGPGERELLVHGNAADPYWLTVQTDMATWLGRLDRNPYAVCVEEQPYVLPAGAEPVVLRTYRVPRKLLQIRRNRPRYSEEYLAELRGRMEQMRAAQGN